MKTLVIGLGNPVLTDDGVGWCVARELQARLGETESVDIEVSARGGLQLMEEMIGYDRAIIVDAIHTGGRPGTIHRLGPGCLPTQHSASGHDVNLSTALEFGRRLDARLPADDDVLLFGIEAEDTTTFGEECTAPVRHAIPLAVASVEATLGEWRNSR